MASRRRSGPSSASGRPQPRCTSRSRRSIPRSSGSRPPSRSATRSRPARPTRSARSRTTRSPSCSTRSVTGGRRTSSAPMRSATQEDGRIADNGRAVDLQWDGAWRSAAVRREDRWTVEFEIPFSTLIYAAGMDRTWKANFVRTLPRRLETVGVVRPGEVGVPGFRFRRSDGHRHARAKRRCLAIHPLRHCHVRGGQGRALRIRRRRPVAAVEQSRRRLHLQSGFRAGRRRRGGHQPHALRGAGAGEASVLPRRHRDVQPALPAVPQPADGRHHLGREVERQDRAAPTSR